VIGLAWRLVRAAGWGRAALLAACTAVVSGLILVAIALLRLGPDRVWGVAGVVSDPDTRGGVVLAIALLTLPPLLLLDQALRLGTASRERRLAALRLGGATPGEVRLAGALEVGIPASAGALLGIAVYGALRVLLGGRIGLVPTTVAPAWWETAATVVAVALLGVGVGLLASRAVVASPLGVTRRVSGRPPRPWSVLIVLLDLPLGLGWLPSPFDMGSTVGPILLVALFVLGVIGLSPWVAHRAGRVAARRARGVPTLLAAGRLMADPRPAGRAAAAVGGIGLVAGGLCAVFLDSAAGDDLVGFVGPAVALALALLAALVVATFSLAVHSIEALLDRRRSIAALVALGVDPEVIAESQRSEIALVALPMAVAGVLLGSLAMGVAGVFADVGPGLVLGMLGTMVVVAVLVRLAVLIAVRLVRPWMLRVADPAGLRTE
jgi:hypothetical protein